MPYIGPLRIYRAPGSVAFLNCANALRPILPKSQAWCVDKDRKFVLQTRPQNYWRIEVSNETTEEKLRIEELKEVLSKVLLFEKTPCPFQRDFVIELPTTPKTPVKKRPWRPVERQQTGRLPSPSELHLQQHGYLNSPVSSPADHSTAGDEVSEVNQSPATFPELQAPTLEPSNLSFDEDIPLQKDKGPHVAIAAELAPDAELQTTLSLPEDDDWREEEGSENFSDATDDTNITPRSQFQPKYQPLIYEPDSDGRPSAMQNCSRSITAPPILSLVTSPPSKHREKSPLGRNSITGSESDLSSSVESFHSIQSWHSPLDPSSPIHSDSSPKNYPYPHEDIVLPKRTHTRGLSELTALPDTPETPGAWKSASPSDKERSLSPPPPKTPTLVNDATDKSDDERPEAITPPTIRPNFRHRATTSSNSRRELSPLPAAVNLFSPPSRRRTRRLQTARHLPTAIIQTTCKILLSPPSHLLHLMLNIASKIAAGEWRGFLSNQGENVYWDFEQEYGADAWKEDDYGISLPPKPWTPKQDATASGADTGGSWEVD